MDAKLTSADVLYMEDGDFKRCGRCAMFLPDGHCSIIGEKVDADDGVCGLYVHGMAMEGAKAEKLVTKAVAGYGADRGLGGYSCGNCRYGGGGLCMHPCLTRFRIRNKGGCCNSWDYGADGKPVKWRDRTGKETVPK